MIRAAISILCCAQLFAGIGWGQSHSDPRQMHSPSVQSVVNPPELNGPPAPKPPVPTATDRRYIESKQIQSANPSEPSTLPPAIRELTALIDLEPTNSDFYMARATLSCYSSENAANIIADIDKSIELHRSSKSSAFDSLRNHYTLKAKIEYQTGRLENAMHDLDAAIAQNYDNADNVFDDGEVKPTTAEKACSWTEHDLDALARRFPKDYRPPLYRGLYLEFFHRFDVESDYAEVLDAFEKAAQLSPASPLPHYFIGMLYTSGGLGGLFSMANAQCLDDVVPRTAKCLALDQAHRAGIRSLTRAIALDPNFRLAYLLRAEAHIKVKEYQQAIRDFDRVLASEQNDATALSAYNDRGLAQAAIGQERAAALDFTHAIALGCDHWCYDNRADAYIKLHDYARAIEDISVSIRKNLASAVFLMNIDQFRLIYPEYDPVPDEVLCEKLRALFYPAMSYANFSKQFLVDAKTFHSTVLPELYVKRGDAYAALGRTAKANAEYDRVSRAFPDWASVSFVEENGKRVRRRD